MLDNYNAALRWLRAALDCKTWHWDPDQWAAAEQTYNAAKEDLEKIKTEWVVSSSCAGVGPNLRFDNEADAIARYEKEISIPSYIRPDRMRLASIAKVTTVEIVEDLTPRLQYIAYLENKRNILNGSFEGDSFRDGLVRQEIEKIDKRLNQLKGKS